MNLLRALSLLEDDENLHSARLLLLLQAFAGRRGDRTVDSLTKLAKLDFLLRYPTYLERALQALGEDADRVSVDDHERKSVESRMVRFRYGPWDHRYRRFLNSLVARGLATAEVQGGSVRIGLTELGLDVSRSLAKTGEYEVVAARAKLLRQHFDKSGSYLKNFIYRTFPEIVSLRWGEEISHADEI